MSAPLPPRRPAPTFAPRFTLSLIYLFGFFFLYCAVLIAPALWEVAQAVPPDIQSNEAAQEATRQAASAAAQQAVQPRLIAAFVASVCTVALGAWSHALPGLNPKH